MACRHTAGDDVLTGTGGSERCMELVEPATTRRSGVLPDLSENILFI